MILPCGQSSAFGSGGNHPSSVHVRNIDPTKLYIQFEDTSSLTVVFTVQYTPGQVPLVDTIAVFSRCVCLEQDGLTMLGCRLIVLPQTAKKCFCEKNDKLWICSFAYY